MSVNPHYEAVLADLKRMKADAEAGIAAIERLMAKPTPVQDTAVQEIDPGPMTNGVQPQKMVQPYSDSIPQRVNRFLASQPGGSYSVGDIAKAIGATNIQTQRGALIRMVASGKAMKHGRGLYRAPRPGERLAHAAKVVAGNDA